MTSRPTIRGPQFAVRPSSVTNPARLSRSAVTCGVAIVVGVLTAGCLNPDCPNKRLTTPFDREAGYRFDSLGSGDDNSDSVFVCVSFSGGGTRAAAFAYGVLLGLCDTQIEIASRKPAKRLLDEVDVISSVSGGSFTAMGYALWHDRLFDGKFERRFLKHNVQLDLILNLLNPRFLLRLPSILLDRSDMAGIYYSEGIFYNRDARRPYNYGDLLSANRRPFVVLNATDMTRRHRFEFTQDDFDLLGSDLASMPVGWAVAASSAFPLILSPLRLEYFPSDAMRSAIEFALNGDEDRRDWRRERWARSLLAKDQKASPSRLEIDEKNHRYLYLLDGGLADNLGVTHFIDSYRRGAIRQNLERDKIDKLVVIIVNAGTDRPVNLERNPTAPGLFRVGERVGTTAISNYSDALTRIIKYALLEAPKAVRAVHEGCRETLDEKCPEATPPTLPPELDVEAYVIDVDFLHVKDAKKRKSFLSMITSFFLPSQDVDDLIEAGRDVLVNHPEFLRLVDDLDGRVVNPGQCVARKAPGRRGR